MRVRKQKADVDEEKRGGVFIEREEERRQEARSPVGPTETFMQKKGRPLYRGRPSSGEYWEYEKNIWTFYWVCTT